MTDRFLCSATKRDGNACDYTGDFWFDGRPWCALHDPNKKASRAELRVVLHAKSREIAKRRRAVAVAALDALATLDPAWHEALTKWIDAGGEMPRRSGT